MHLARDNIFLDRRELRSLRAARLFLIDAFPIEDDAVDVLRFEIAKVIELGWIRKRRDAIAGKIFLQCGDGARGRTHDEDIARADEILHAKEIVELGGVDDVDREREATRTELVVRRAPRRRARLREHVNGGLGDEASRIFGIRIGRRVFRIDDHGLIGRADVIR